MHEGVRLMSYGWVAKKSEQVTPSTRHLQYIVTTTSTAAMALTTTTTTTIAHATAVSTGIQYHNHMSQGSAVMRGPRSSAVATQMLTLTDWGELDYLVIDMPPGGCCVP